jgi:hypothetical protein
MNAIKEATLELTRLSHEVEELSRIIAKSEEREYMAQGVITRQAHEIDCYRQSLQRISMSCSKCHDEAEDALHEAVKAPRRVIRFSKTELVLFLYAAQCHKAECEQQGTPKTNDKVLDDLAQKLEIDLHPLDLQLLLETMRSRQCKK